MQIAIPLETKPGEARVALTPELAAKLIKQGFEVVLEHGAGEKAGFTDAAYQAAGVKLVAANSTKTADVVLSVQPLAAAEMTELKSGAITISFLPVAATQSIQAAQAAKVTAFSL